MTRVSASDGGCVDIAGQLSRIVLISEGVFTIGAGGVLLGQPAVLLKDWTSEPLSEMLLSFAPTLGTAWVVIGLIVLQVPWMTASAASARRLLLAVVLGDFLHVYALRIWAASFGAWDLPTMAQVILTAVFFVNRAAIIARPNMVSRCRRNPDDKGRTR
eukprot:CAMPEP_0197438320 /NCGR_PEP_ID=MMETSP1175-20131217/5354_1 /TAXON_ID=1003142 /ORGANISM="Triceratium dubium, Strain CCMP147" /LENGTH=158 /DNA_ID=CAMNT_0042968027 /DNA_START=208 /DNA_END=684 /DNA_ORIENTATION=-